jgi:hypothetical protein
MIHRRVRSARGHAAGDTLHEHPRFKEVLKESEQLLDALIDICGAPSEFFGD